MKNQRGEVVFSILIGVAVALMVAASTDEIMRRVFDADSNALRVTAVGGLETGLTVGTTEVSGGTNNRLLKQAAGVLQNSLLSDDGTNVTLASGQHLGPVGAAATPGFSFTGIPGNLPWNGLGASNTGTPDSVSGTVPLTSTGGTITGSCKLATAPGSGKSWALQMDGGCAAVCSSGAVGCTVADLATSCEFAATGCDSVAGARCRWQGAPTNTPATTYMGCSGVWTMPE